MYIYIYIYIYIISVQHNNITCAPCLYIYIYIYIYLGAFLSNMPCQLFNYFQKASSYLSDRILNTRGVFRTL